MLLALALLPLIPCVAMVFYRHPLFLLSLFPLFNLVEVFFPSYYVKVGPLQLLPMDPVYFFTLIHLGICALRQPTKTAGMLKKNIFLTMFLTLVAVYVVLYTPVYGQSAVGEARKFYFIFLIPLLAAISIKQPEDLRRFILVVILSATCVAVFAFAKAAMQGSIVRILNAEGTLIVALAAFSMIVHRLHRLVVINPTLDRILLLVFSVIVLFSAQRSVWLAVGFGLSLTLWLYRARSSVVAKIVMAVFVVLLWLSTGLALFPNAGARLVEHFEGIINPSADVTASWRIEGWRQQLDKQVEQGDFLFGNGLGNYYSWQVRSHTVAGVEPHNAYVQMVLKFGLCGLLIYGLVALQFFCKTLAVRKKLRPGPAKAYVEMGIINVGAAHAFAMGYGFDPVMLIFFAVAISAVNLSENFQRSPRFPSLSKMSSQYAADRQLEPVLR